MTQKTTLTLLGILLLVVGGYVANLLVNKASESVGVSNKEIIADFNAADITKITLQKGAEAAIVLAKNNDAWQIASVDNAAADSAAVGQLLSMLEDVKIQTIIARQLDEAVQYGLDQAQRIHITLSTGENTVAELLVGKVGSAPRTFYAAKPNDSNIYLVDGTYYLVSKTDWTAPKSDDTDESSTE